MVTSSRDGWFTRKSMTDEVVLTCPRCGHGFPFGPSFDHHPRPCPFCKTKLIELATLTVVYLVDPDTAPRIVNELIKHLHTMTEPDAERELMILMRFLGVDPVI